MLALEIALHAKSNNRREKVETIGVFLFHTTHCWAASPVKLNQGGAGAPVPFYACTSSLLE